MTFHSIICVNENCVSKNGTPCFVASHLFFFCFSLHSKSTPGLHGLNDFITEVSIHAQKEPYLTCHKRSRPPKEYRLVTRRRD